jgi:hypothetical protein
MFFHKRKNINDYRTEVKYTLEGFSRVKAVKSLQYSRQFFGEIFSRRWINNVYFDTSNLDLYRSSIEGTSERVKVRIRWYGEMYGEIKPVLELKIKKGLMNTKESYQLDKFIFNQEILKIEFKYLILRCKNVPIEIKNYIKLVEPTLLNRYYRSYHLSSSKRYRITIDTNLYFKSLRSRQKLGNACMYKERSFIILEVKYDNFYYDTSSIMTNLFIGARVTQISKYTYGLAVG